MAEDKCEFLYKITIIGAISGKTCLLRRIIEDTYNSSIRGTISLKGKFPFHLNFLN